MSIVRLLPDRARFADKAETVDPVTRRVVVPDGAVITDGITIAEGVPARAVRRDERTVVRDETNRVIVDADLIFAPHDGDGKPVPPIPPGTRVELESGERYVTAGTPAAKRRRTLDPHHFTVTARSVET